MFRNRSIWVLWFFFGRDLEVVQVEKYTAHKDVSKHLVKSTIYEGFLQINNQSVSPKQRRKPQ